ncbi:MFS transporter [Novosphingobium sp. SG720]|uniref:MFS transporter n=1 Tax=Novosphingobium sp. SG720 TaxID=2586998 RepID=UPI00144754C3|nr:MFS transporter [Novosphingobium sp. SG720]NKJ43654.1 MFS family permease [Novosphingobium sp. SG720]
MTTTTHLLRARRFLPLFVTQLLGAFNDNLFKNAMVLFVVFSVYNSEKAEAHFSGMATALFIIPFVALSALSGQLADMRDKARIIRIVKTCEIGIMGVGAAGLLLAWKGFHVEGIAIPLMLLALFAMGVHSTFFGPIKYAILPQHLHADEVLAGTGLVEAGTYMAILAGTIVAGYISAPAAAITVIVTALIGFFAGRSVPDAPPEKLDEPLALPLLRPFLARPRSLARAVGLVPVVVADQVVSLYRLVHSTTRHPRVFLAIAAISFFWAVGAILFVQFPPLAKNVLGCSKEVASLFLVIFSVGIAIGSISINRLLKGTVSARYAPACVVGTGLFVAGFHFVCAAWPVPEQRGLLNLTGFITAPLAVPLVGTLLGIAITGGMFIVPLYAFLTTVVEKCEAARTIAANNIVNSAAMLVGSLLAMGLTAAGVRIVDQLLLTGVLCLISAWLGWLLYRAERVHLGEREAHTFDEMVG